MRKVTVAAVVFVHFAAFAAMWYGLGELTFRRPDLFWFGAILAVFMSFVLGVHCLLFVAEITGAPFQDHDKQLTAKGEKFKYWPKKQPVPEGWELVDTLEGTNHGRYAVLIQRV